MVIGVTYDEADVPGWMLWLILGWAIARLLIDVVLTAYRYLSNYCTSGIVQTMNEFFCPPAREHLQQEFLNREGLNIVTMYSLGIRLLRSVVLQTYLHQAKFTKIISVQECIPV